MTKAVRIVIDILLALMSGPFLIRGGLSRYASAGIPAQSDWRMLVIGIVLLGAALICLRPHRFRRS